MMKADNITLSDDKIIHYFYPMSIFKLVIMQIMTLGFYQIFWWFKQWNSIRDTGNLRIEPTLRSILYIFYYVPFILRVYYSDTEKSIPLIFMFLITVIMRVFSSPLKGISQIIASIILLLIFTVNYVVIQMKINKLYFKDKPQSIETNFSFNFSSYSCMVMGIVVGYFWVMAILESL